MTDPEVAAARDQERYEQIKAIHQEHGSDCARDSCPTCVVLRVCAAQRAAGAARLAELEAEHAKCPKRMTPEEMAVLGVMWVPLETYREAVAAGAAAERERIKEYLNEWAAAYHEDLFRPLVEGEAAEVNATYHAFSDRVAAQQGRHMARELLKQLDRAQPVAPPEEA